MLLLTAERHSSAKHHFALPLALLVAAFGPLTAGCNNTAAPNGEIAVETAEAVPVAAERPESEVGGAAATLQFSLKAGDRFPIIKTIQQELRQPTADGWESSDSQLELRMVVTVEEVYASDRRNKSSEPDPRIGQKRLSVQYHRVKFTQDLAGKHVEYDSANPPDVIPSEAWGFSGLKDNGFQFWMSGNNEILENVGFEQFLDRCVRDFPPAQRAAARAQLAISSGSDGIANFVDDSIGLLPNRPVRMGDTWSKERTIIQPVPMHIESDYSVARIGPDTVDIDLLGRITTAAAYGARKQNSKDVFLTIRGGHAFGHVRIDRASGLPVDARIEQTMQMNVSVAGGDEFDQFKTTITTIRAFPKSRETSLPQSVEPTAETNPPQSDSPAIASQPASDGNPAEKAMLNRSPAASAEPRRSKTASADKPNSSRRR